MQRKGEKEADIARLTGRNEMEQNGTERNTPPADGCLLNLSARLAVCNTDADADADVNHPTRLMATPRDL